MPPFRLLVDARCLQDEGLRFRGVGQFTAMMLRRCRFEFETPSLIGIVDGNLPDLPGEHLALFDAVITTASVSMDANTWFLQPSPMTHPVSHIARCLSHLVSRRICIIYDFIPLDLSALYLRNRVARFDYDSSLSALVNYDTFVSISDFTQRRLLEIFGELIRKAYISGVPVRAGLVEQRVHTSGPSATSHVLVIAGDDPRKNVETAIVAHARSAAIRSAGTQMIVVGGYSQARRAELARLFTASGGQPHLFKVLSDVTDEVLAAVYRNALVTVCPSLIEGFSIPVIEANALECPVIVSACDAHKELISWPEDQFEPTDVDGLQQRLECYVASPAYRKEALARQNGVWERFTEERCGERFWSPIRLAAAGVKSPALNRKARPRIALVTPLPPAKSGVADFSMATLKAMTQKANVEVFCDTTAARAQVRPISAYPYISRQFDAVISVIGNNEIHRAPFENLLEFGGAAIAHDARLLDYYYWICGKERAVAQASRELGRPVDLNEIEAWLGRPDLMQTLFLGEIVRAGSPTFVHSKITQNLISKLYGAETIALPFAAYRGFPESLWEAAAKQQARERLGIAGDKFLVATFGGVSMDRLPAEVLWSIQMLRFWGINAVLAFVGAAPEGLANWLRSEAKELGIEECVHVSSSFFDEAAYRDFLVAADAAVQLRLYDFGGLSGALSDCIEAALPSVANQNLAEAMEAPFFVRRVPNGISPVLIAEQLANIHETESRRPLDEAREYRRSHSFDRYVDMCLHALGLEPTAEA